jgi:hypothetical protein
MQIEQERNPSGAKRWLRIGELPCSRAFFYSCLSDNPEIISVTIRPPGSKKGIRLICANSLDRYLEKLAVQQAQERSAHPRAVKKAKPVTDPSTEAA